MSASTFNRRAHLIGFLILLLLIGVVLLGMG